MTPFGNFLEQIRRSRRLQQNDLAARIDVNPCYISSLERGRKGPPSPELLQKLSATLKLSSSEAEQLRISVEQSQKVIKLPDDTSLEEYAFLADIRRRIGSLSHDEISAMRHILNLGEKVSRERVL
ncbi:MAG: helix-turn-helix domain-containing protein [Cellvibrionaceae bacterium]